MNQRPVDLHIAPPQHTINYLKANTGTAQTAVEMQCCN